MGLGQSKTSKVQPVADGRICNLVTLGIGGVGKSALTIQFVQDKFIKDYDPTIEDSYRKQVTVDNKVSMLNIWDTAGQEEYEALQDGYIREADGFIIVYSITDTRSFNSVSKLHKKIYRVRESSHEPIIIIGNKCDLDVNREITTAEGVKLAEELNCHFMEASAKAKICVEEAFFDIIRQIRQQRR